jgi:hypothetical protein
MSRTTLEQVIKRDPTLDNNINNFKIDWFNDHQVNLRFASIKIALAYYIEKRSKEIEREVNSERYLHMQYVGRMNRVVLEQNEVVLM